MLKRFAYKIVYKIINDNMLMRRIVRRDIKRKKYFKGTALAFYLWPVKNSITPDEKITAYLTMAFKNYYDELQDLLRVAKVESFELTRTGAAYDGGYILLDDFHEGGIAYSFGISSDVSWDKDMASRGYDVFMYDHTIENLPEENSRFHWQKLGIADGKTQDERLKTLEELISRNHHENEKNMILKMDVEGAEWGFFQSVNPEVLKQFAQMTFEFHSVNSPENPEQVLKVFRKINKTHQLIHIHANNNGNYVSIGGKKFCSLFELTYVLRDKYSFSENYDVNLPLSIDAPNITDYPEIELGRWNEQVKIDDSVIEAIKTI